MMLLSQPLLRAVEEAGRWAAGQRDRLKVSGRSMVPTLNDGERVLYQPGAAPAVGDLAVALHPDHAAHSTPGLLIVKRVSEIDGDGKYVLTSDNPDEGTDSRQWGPLEPTAIAGRVTLILDRPTARLSPDDGKAPRSGGWARWLRR